MTTPNDVIDGKHLPTKVSLLALVTIDDDGNRVNNQELYETLLAASGQAKIGGTVGKSLMLMSVSEIPSRGVVGTFMAGEITPKGATPPVAPFIGYAWLQRAQWTDKSKPLIDVTEILKMWDGTAYVDASPELAAKGIMNASGIEYPPCKESVLGSAYGGVVVQAPPADDNYVAGKWYADGLMYRRAKTTTAINPSATGNAGHAAAWSNAYTMQQLHQGLQSAYCTFFSTWRNAMVEAGQTQSGDFGSWASSAGKNTIAYYVHSILEAETTAGIKVWELGDSGANGNGIVLGSNGKWYLANPSGKPAENDPAATGSNPTHWIGGFDSLADLIASAMVVSPDEGNLIQQRTNGIYYGIIPPIHLAHQFISNDGIDADTDTDGSYRGSREKPLKTLKFALDRLGQGMTGNIYLHEGQAFDVYAENPAIAKGDISISLYGPNQDSLNTSWSSRNIWNPSGAINAIHAKIKAHSWLNPAWGKRAASAFYPANNAKVLSVGVDYETCDEPLSEYLNDYWAGAFSNPSISTSTFEMSEGILTLRGSNAFSRCAGTHPLVIVMKIDKIGGGVLLDCGNTNSYSLTRYSRAGQPEFFQTTLESDFDSGGYVTNYDSSAPMYNYLQTNANLPSA